jgi:hypothetical protein
MELEKPDTIIPMTHQNMPWDRLLAGMNIGFPVIIGMPIMLSTPPYCVTTHYNSS